MTLLVWISGGRSAKIKNGIMVFKNEKRGYPIRGVPDNL